MFGTVRYLFLLEKVVQYQYQINKQKFKFWFLYQQGIKNFKTVSEYTESISVILYDKNHQKIIISWPNLFKIWTARCEYNSAGFEIAQRKNDYFR